MIQPVAKPRLFEFDPIYDTRTDKHYGFSRIGLIGILKIILGIALIGLCIGDMNDGAYRSVNFFGGRVLTWSENPWWPTYGKGIWVGLMLMAVGVFGIVAHFEVTYTAIKVFGYSSLIVAIFLFYLVISTIKEIQFGQMALTFQFFNIRPLFYTYSLNSAMAAIGSLSFVLSLITGIASLLMIDYEDDYRVEPFGPYGPTY
ncbi:hypothetical protein BpHYR1_012272 [Brachionus plicatilis]|uniref:Uncharacterized protein n=1 Tax=Brachionus plicatilis TaxID=10195 RepID=A0A3M7PU17_BRAPC|nr:hypothetical protein BpHYR1_012272 [Brachionus plicatilis]